MKSSINNIIRFGFRPGAVSFPACVCIVLVYIVHRSKIEKVQSGIQGGKSSRDMEVRGIWSQQLEHKQVTKRATEPGVIPC